MSLRSLLAALAAFVLVGAVFAGCIGKNPAPTDVGTNNVKPNGQNDLLAPPVVHTPLGATVSASETWVLPGDTATFSASNVTGRATGTVHYEWLYGMISPDEIAMWDQAAMAGMSASGGMSMSGMSMESMPHTHSKSSLDTGNLTPGASKSIVFQRLGDYWMHCHPHPWMGMNISVRPGGPTTPVTVFIEEKDLGNKYTWSFFPQNVSVGWNNSIVVGPQTKITWINKGVLVHTATQMYWDPYLQSVGTGPTLQYKFPTAGNWRIILKLTDDANGLGLVRTNVFVDPARPNPVVTKEFTGNFSAAASPVTDSDPLGESGHFSFKVDYDGTGPITFKVNTPSPAPTPADLTATFTNIDTKATLATLTSAKPTWTGAVPAGTYNVVVTASQAFQVTYDVKLVDTQKLVPPPGFHVHA